MIGPLEVDGKKRKYIEFLKNKINTQNQGIDNILHLQYHWLFRKKNQKHETENFRICKKKL